MKGIDAFLSAASGAGTAQNEPEIVQNAAATIEEEPIDTENVQRMLTEARIGNRLTQFIANVETIQANPKINSGSPPWKGFERACSSFDLEPPTNRNTLDLFLEEIRTNKSHIIGKLADLELGIEKIQAVTETEPDSPLKPEDTQLAYTYLEHWQGEDTRDFQKEMAGFEISQITHPKILRAVLDFAPFFDSAHSHYQEKQDLPDSERREELAKIEHGLQEINKAICSSNDIAAIGFLNQRVWEKESVRKTEQLRKDATIYLKKWQSAEKELSGERYTQFDLEDVNNERLLKMIESYAEYNEESHPHFRMGATVTFEEHRHLLSNLETDINNVLHLGLTPNEYAIARFIKELVNRQTEKYYKEVAPVAERFRSNAVAFLARWQVAEQETSGSRYTQFDPERIHDSALIRLIDDFAQYYDENHLAHNMRPKTGPEYRLKVLSHLEAATNNLLHKHYGKDEEVAVRLIKELVNREMDTYYQEQLRQKISNSEDTK